MDFNSLPQFRGMQDSPKVWGEPDARGETPAMRLRDYVVLSLLVALCMPMLSRLVVDSWIHHWRVDLQAASVHQIQMEVFQAAYERKRIVP